MRARAVGAIAMIAAWAVWAPPAGATVMVEVPLEDMVRDADAIVHGVVVRSGVRFVMGTHGLEPHTLTQVEVRTWISGEGEARRITVRELGGQTKTGGMRIAGTPTYHLGEEVVLFLVHHPEHGNDYRTYGMAQGKFTVTHGVPGVPSFVRRDLDGLAFAHWTDGKMHVEDSEHGGAMELGVFLDTVRGLLPARAPLTSGAGSTGALR